MDLFQHETEMSLKITLKCLLRLSLGVDVLAHCFDSLRHGDAGIQLELLQHIEEVHLPKQN